MQPGGRQRPPVLDKRELGALQGLGVLRRSGARAVVGGNLTTCTVKSDRCSRLDGQTPTPVPPPPQTHTHTLTYTYVHTCTQPPRPLRACLKMWKPPNGSDRVKLSIEPSPMMVGCAVVRSPLTLSGKVAWGERGRRREAEQAKGDPSVSLGAPQGWHRRARGLRRSSLSLSATPGRPAA